MVKQKKWRCVVSGVGSGGLWQDSRTFWSLNAQFDADVADGWCWRAEAKGEADAVETGIHQHNALDVSTQGAAEYYQRVYTRSICSIRARLLVDTT